MLRSWRGIITIILTGGILLAIMPISWAQQTRPLDIMLVLDQSGSMRQNDPQRLMGQALGHFIGQLGPEDGIGLILFGTRAEVVQPLNPLGTGNQREALLTQIAQIRYVGKYTNIAAGIERGLYELKLKGRTESIQALVFITDGIMDTGDPDQNNEMKRWLREQLLQEASERGVRIFSIALTEQADFMLIQEMAAATKGEYFRAMNALDMVKTFDQIHSLLAKLVEESSKALDILPSPIATALPEPTTPPTPDLVPTMVPSLPAPVRLKSGILLWLGGGIILLLILLIVLIMILRSRRQVTIDPDRAQANLEQGKRVKPGRAPGALTPQSLSPTATGAKPSSPIPPAKLIDLKTGTPLLLTKEVIRVGREPSNDIVIPEVTVSGRHAQIEFRKGQFYLKDLRSSNGTFVNKQKVEGEVLLKSGDIVRFDQFGYTFMGPEATAGGTVLRDRSAKTEVRERRPTQAGSDAPIVPDTSDSKSGVPHKTEVLKSPPSATTMIDTENQEVASLKCPVHNSIDATIRCSRCGRLWCRICVQPVKGVLLCRECRKGVGAD